MAFGDSRVQGRRHLLTIQDWVTLEVSTERVFFDWFYVGERWDSFMVAVVNQSDRDGYMRIETSEVPPATEDNTFGVSDPLPIAAGKQASREIGPNNKRGWYRVQVSLAAAPYVSGKMFRGWVRGLER